MDDKSLFYGLRRILMHQLSEKTAAKILSFAMAVIMVVTLMPGLAGLDKSAVYAGQDDGWDLNNFVKSVTVKDDTGIEVNLDQSGTFTYGNTYTFNINFAEDANIEFEYNAPVPDGRLIYQLPSQLQIVNAVNDGKIMKGQNIIGWYTIDTSGRVEVWFGDYDKEGNINPTGENFIYAYTDASFYLDIEAVFTKGGSDDDIIFGTEAKITINKTTPTPKLEVTKSNTYDNTAETVSYKVTIKAPASNEGADPEVLKNIRLTDIPTIGTSVFASATPASVYSAINYTVFKANNEAKSTGTIPVTSSPSQRINYTFPDSVELAPGEYIEVIYSLDIQKLFPANNSGSTRNSVNYSFALNNTATATSGELTAMDTSNRTVTKSATVAKTGNLAAGNRIHWTSTITGDSNSGKLNGGTITDTYTSRTGNTGSFSGADMTFPNPSQINITLYGKNNAVIGTYTAADFGTAFSITNNVFTFVVPSTYGDVYRIVFDYYTDISNVLPTGTSNKTFRNTVSYGDLSIDRDVTVSPPSVTKNGEKVTGQNKITWTSTIGGTGSPTLNGGTITDTLGEGMSFPALDNISITLYGLTDSNILTAGTVYKASDFGTAIKIVGNVLTFYVPTTGYGNINRVVIGYTTDFTPPKEGETAKTFRNDIKFNIYTGYSTVTINPPATYGIGFIEKIATTKSGTTTTIPWRSTIGNGSETLNGKTIKDVITSNTAGVTFDIPQSASSYTITLYGKPTGVDGNNYATFTTGDQISTATISTAVRQGWLNITGNTTFEYTIPTTVQDVYQVVITYTSNVTRPDYGEGNITYTNKISIGDRESSDYVTKTPPTPSSPSVSKGSSHIKEISPGVYGIEYTVTATIPAGNNISTSNYNRIYLRDDMTISGQSIDLGLLKPEDFTVTLNTPEPDFKYNVVVKPGNVPNRWEIYFGGGTSTTTSAWQYGTAKTVTVTYTIPLSLLTTGSVNMPVEDILKSSASNELRNTAYVYRNTSNWSDTVYDAWPIFKKASESSEDDSVFNYTVTLNGGSANSRIQLFKEGEAALFIDEFDAGLEYVPKSFYVTDSSGNNRAFGPYTGSSGAAVGNASVSENLITVENGKITVDFSKLRQLNWNGTLAASTIASSSSTTWYTHDYTYTIHYQLRVADPDAFANGAVFGNKATIISSTQDNTSFSSDASVSYDRKPLSKRLLASDGGNIVSAEIIINPHGRKLVPAEYGQDWFTAVDTMSDNLAIYINSVQFFTQTKDGGNWTGTWKTEPEPKGVAGELWSVNPIDAQTVEFKLPDSTPVRIVYDAYVMIPVGKEDAINNKIEVYGYAATAKDDHYKVQKTSAGASADKMPITLFKKDLDEYSNENLTGAEFELYMALPSNNPYPGGASAKMISVGGVKFYQLTNVTGMVDGKIATGPDGTILFDSSWMTPTHKAIYMIVETKAPAGYILPAAPDNYTFFCLPGMDETSAFVNSLKTDYQTVYNGSVKMNYVADMITVYNEMKQTGELRLSGTKIINDGAPEPSSPFTFTVYEGGSSIASGTTASWEDGHIVFQTIEYGMDDIGIHTYVIKENEPLPPGWSKAGDTDITIYVEVKANLDGGESLSVKAYSDQGCTKELTSLEGLYQVDFVNEYIPDKTSWTPEATKTAAGRDMAAGQFSFSLYKSDDEGNQGDLIETVQNTSGGSSSNVTFATIEYDKKGSYYYLLKETSVDGNGWTVDTTVYRIWVYVTDDGQGKLSAEAKYRDGYSWYAYNKTVGKFANTYEPGDAPAVVEGTKAITGPYAGTALDFTFAIKEVSESGAAVTGGYSATTTRNGAGGFSFDIPARKPGTYYFQITEQGTDGNGWTYDKHVLTAKVVITDNNGTATAAVTYPAGSQTFTNNYEQGDAPAKVEGTKAITGSYTGTALDFTFAIKEVSESGTAVTGGFEATTTRNGAGGFSFDIPARKPGTYYFQVTEQGTDGNGWTYDKHVLTAKVVVTDNNDGTATAAVTYPAGSQTFTNSYEQGDAPAVVEGTKAITGPYAGTALDFTFAIKEVSESGTAVTGGYSATTTRNGAGGFSFDIPARKPGTYYFQVTEQGTDGNGWTYDKHVLTAKVVVTDNNDGTATAAVTYPAGSQTFTNDYKPESTSWTPEALKTAEIDETATTEMEAGQFTFALYASNDQGTQGSLIETVSNTSAGKSSAVTFTAIGYDAIGTHYYLLGETSEDGNGWTVDGTVYLIKIDVTDNDLGKLETEVTWYIWSEGDAESGWVEYNAEVKEFVNTYDAGKAPAEIEGVKEISSNYTGEDKTFTFYLTEVTDITGETEVNAENGGFADTATITVTAAAGYEAFSFSIPERSPGTYYFKVTEDQTGDDVSGWKYSKAEYIVIVDITDSGIGVPDVNVVYPTGSEVPMTYVNTYDASGELILEGIKATDGVAADLNQFSFVVTEDGEFVTAGSSDEIAMNAESGNIIFDPIYYTFDDIGIHEYVITENPAGDNWKVMTDPVTIWVKVADNGLGELLATAYSDASCEPEFEIADLAVYLTFENELVGQIEIIKVIEGDDPFDSEEYDETAPEFTVRLLNTETDEYLSFRLIKEGDASNTYLFVDPANFDESAGYTVSTDVTISAVKSAIIAGIPAGTEIKVEEIDADVWGWALFTTISYPGDGESVKITGQVPAEEDPLEEDPLEEDPIEEESGIQIVTVTNRYELASISVEVDIDTIRRTSAAFDGTDANVTLGDEGSFVNNVNAESYRYDVNFRSTSNVDAEEFVLDIPLEAVTQNSAGVSENGFVRIETLWTPTVWGDKDGRMNVWYKTNDGTGNEAQMPVPQITDVANPLYPTNPSDGWKLWTTVTQGDFDIDDQPLIKRVRLEVSDLGVDNVSTYITAIRFEFGAVKVGFTSKNDEYDSNNVLDQGAEGIRFTNGSGDYIGGLIDPPADPDTGGNVGPLSTPVQAVKALISGITSFFTTIPAYGAEGDDSDLLPIPLKGTETNWAPKEGRSDYAKDLDELNPTLKPATYMVTAPMPLAGEEIEIVSSASALIATSETAGGKKPGGISLMGTDLPGYGQIDSDQDAVLTRVISPFLTDIIPQEYGSIDGEIIIPPRYEGDSVEDGTWYTNGRAARTFDTFAINLWAILSLAALVCVMLLIREFFPAFGLLKRRNKDGVSRARKGGAL